jgi:HTH-type transcriptional regulator/antitoxin HigA
MAQIQKNTKEYIEQKKKQGLYGIDFDIAEHPGTTLKDEILCLGMSQLQFAEKIGCAEQTINRIINEKEPVTSEMAVKIETALGGRPSAEFWNNMQKSYDLYNSRLEAKSQAEKDIAFFDSNLKNVFDDLKKYNFISNISLSKKEYKIEAILELKKYFGILDFSLIFKENDLDVAFRKYQRAHIDNYAVAGWLRTGTKIAQERLNDIENIPEYNQKKLLEQLNNLKKLSRESQREFLEKLRKDLFDCGVLVIYLPGFRNTHIGGALKWLKNHPIIMLKTYKQREDIFWFNLFHEIGHIIKHSKKDFFMDFKEIEGSEGERDDKEKTADLFATNFLLPSFDKIVEEIKTLHVGNFETALQNVANTNDVSLSVLAGRLCYELSKRGKDKAWANFNKYRKVIEIEPKVFIEEDLIKQSC